MTGIGGSDGRAISLAEVDVKAGADWTIDRVRLNVRMVTGNGEIVTALIDMTEDECTNLRSRMYDAERELEAHRARRSGAV